jgi:hypothetical protein
MQGGNEKHFLKGARSGWFPLRGIRGSPDHCTYMDRHGAWPEFELLPDQNLAAAILYQVVFKIASQEAF